MYYTNYVNLALLQLCFTETHNAPVQCFNIEQANIFFLLHAMLVKAHLNLRFCFPDCIIVACELKI